MNKKITSRLLAGATTLAMLGTGASAWAVDDTAPAGRRIGYAFVETGWAVYETKDGKEECPQGAVQLGPREQYKMQFPEDGTKRKLIDTELARESDIFFPTDKADQFPFYEATGKTSIGLNLDGKVKSSDFTSPDGKPGVDNQMFRVVGCINNYRSAGSVLNFDKIFFKSRNINRIMIELTDVDSLINDDDITISMYRGLDPLLNDATGNNYTPGSTERIDNRFGKVFMIHAKGKIVNGVLITQPMDINVPHEAAYQEAAYDWMRDARFEIRLTPEKAEGIIGGYADIESMYQSRNRSWSTHHLSYGQQAQASVYRKLKHYADAYPGKDGKNMAISAAYSVKLVMVRVVHPDKQISEASPSSKQFADSGAK